MIFQRFGDNPTVALPRAYQQDTTRPNCLAITLCAAILLTLVSFLGFGTASATDVVGHDVESTLTMDSDLITANGTRHSDDDCGHDHQSSECSPCPTCSGALPFMENQGSTGKAIDQEPLPQPRYAGIVPKGIRRPPRIS